MKQHSNPHQNIQSIWISSCVSSEGMEIVSKTCCRYVRVVASAANMVTWCYMDTSSLSSPAQHAQRPLQLPARSAEEKKITRRLQLQLKSNAEGTLLSSKLQWATWFCLRPTSSMELKGSRANWWCIDTWHGSTSHDRRPHSWKRMADTNPSTRNWFTDWRWLALKSTDHLETLLDSFGTTHSLESPLQTLGRPCYGPVASS